MCSEGQSKQVPRQILPGNVKPSNYKLTITPAFETVEFSGTVHVLLDILESTSRITANAKEITVSKAVVCVSGLDQTATEIIFNAEKETVEFKFEKEIPKGSSAVLKIDFKGIHNDSMAGFYRSGYTDSNGSKKYLVVTQFEATDCRRCFPSWDEPNLKATFDVTLIIPTSRTALSNMPIVSETRLDHGLLSVTFATTPIMSTYLLAMCVGEFDYLEATAYPVAPVSAKPILCRTYTLPGQKELGRFGLQVCVKTLEFFSKYFDVVYPLPKMDMIAIPDFGAGAMENWGLVTYRETALLYDPSKSSAKAKERVAYVVGHELAHQWFGNLVTMDWWSELWLNEGFATFVGWLAVDHIFPEWNVFTSFLIGEYARGVGLDALRSSHPIEVEVNSATEIGQIFDAISYSKGASVIRMLNDSLGGDVFAKGVSAYLKSNSFGNATTVDLWNALSKAAGGRDVGKMMYAWTRKVGYPYLSITSETYHAEKGEMTLGLAQSRFLSTGDLSAEEDKECPIWHIPIPLVTFDGKEGSECKSTVCFLDTKSGSITFPFSQKQNSFYKLNANVSGFYRVNYSSAQLMNLSKAIQKSRVSSTSSASLLFTTQDRIGIINDVFAFARAGQASTTDALSLLHTAFQGEKDQMVLECIANRLGSLKQIWYKDEEALNGISMLQRLIFSPIVKELGFEYPEGEDQLTVLKRNVCVAAAVDAKDEQVVSELLGRYQKYVLGEKNAFHANLREPIFKVALQQSTSASRDFEFIIGIYTNSSSTADEKIAALTSLGATNDLSIVDLILNKTTLDSSIVKLQDSPYPVGSLAALSPMKDKVLPVLWNWLIANWPTLHKSLSPTLSLLGRVVQACVSSNIGHDFALKVEAWARGDDCATNELKLARTKEIKNVQRPLDQALEAMRGNTKWYESAQDQVSKFFKAMP